MIFDNDEDALWIEFEHKCEWTSVIGMCDAACLTIDIYIVHCLDYFW